MIYRSILDPELIWTTAAALEAWIQANPGDVRGHIVEIIQQEAKQ